jgi:hypothetical protein
VPHRKLLHLGVLWGAGSTGHDPVWRTENPAALVLAHRWKIERVIEWGLEVLEWIDGDPDLEPSADAELSLGWSAPEAARNGPWLTDGGLTADSEE